jgi:AraC-like DNA-binding protein
MADTGDAGQRSVLGQLTIDLAGVPSDCWHFFETIFTCSPRLGNVRLLARHLDVTASTLMSRFFRAGVPTPKRYLAMARLVRAARLFENSGFSIANVANHLDYSSPQSFGRHVRTLLDTTAGEFREQYDYASMFAKFRTDLIIPYIDELHTLRPLTAPAGWASGILKSRRSTPPNPS